MFVRFISDSSNEGQGFKITYEAKSLACGGNIYIHDADSAGYVTSPNHPDHYPQHADCVWLLAVPPGKLIRLQFEDQFNIEVSPNCTSSYLELRDGADSNAPVLSKFCGTSLPASQLSSGDVMYLRFRSDNSPTHVGFKAKYSIAQCGGTVTGQSGVIESNGYPTLPYADNLFCDWHLQGPLGHYLTLRFEDFNLQNSSGCERDFVEIWENHTSGHLLGRFCGDTIPNSIDTSGNVALVRFVTDSSLSASGFRLRFDASVEECGGDLRGPTGTFTSPNYLNPNPHGWMCEWRITVQEGRRVTLTFNNLRLEARPFCSSEHVMVFNGIRSNSPQLEKLCSSVNGSNEIKSSGNTMKVIYFTDGSRPYGGFTASYTSSEDAGNADGLLMWRLCGSSQPAIPLVIPYPQKVTNLISDCGGIQIGDSGVISSPNYPASYDSLTHCSWLLEAPPGHTITVSSDDWKCVSSRSLGLPKLSLSSHTDDFFHDNFSGCGGILHSDNGTIRSPHWPQNFPENSRCSWTVITHQSKHLEISFDNNFLIPSGDGQCQNSFVKVWAGAQEADRALMATSCGNVAPGAIVTPGNAFTAVFQSQEAPAQGFSASFMSLCGRTFTNPSDYIVSPNYPKQYDNNMNCTYIIEADPLSVVLLTFVSFHLEGKFILM
ncbi:Cubilin [Camelus dromedarius]|uniref:Cubilin n=1 Tax=Camelus dromedarius TaxID=9838 RepID=A0A5N4C4J8_CAMDR|nr:Cubilin [Camelus dromedarius]